MKLFLAALVSLLCVSCAQYSQLPLNTVGHVDLPAYMGRWYVVACMDNKVERKFVRPTETYALRPDGVTIDTFFTTDSGENGEQKSYHFLGKVYDPGTNAQWDMHLFPLVAPRYEIIGIGPGYRWAVVGNQSRKFGWILSRRRYLSEADYAKATRIMAYEHYDTSKLIRLPQ